MDKEQIKVGDIVRHRHIMKGTDLSVFAISGNMLSTRYASQGLFQTQGFFEHEVELHIEDKDEHD